jgi:regulator of replication initiation timing
MEIKTACACFLVFSLLTFQNVNASDKDVFNILFERIDRLEINDVANKREIASLKAEIKSLKINAMEKENDLVSEIKELKSRLLDSEVKQRAMENGLEMNDSDKHPSKGRQPEIDAATSIQHASKVERKSVTGYLVFYYK